MAIPGRATKIPPVAAATLAAWCFTAFPHTRMMHPNYLRHGSVLRGGAGRLLSSDSHQGEAAEPASQAPQSVHHKSPLLSLGPELVRAIVVRRPSERNKSPYVGDVKLVDGGRVALAHMPSLGLGGKCKAGSEVLLKVAVDSKGRPLGANAPGKWNSPKCEFIMQVCFLWPRALHKPAAAQQLSDRWRIPQLVHVADPANSQLGGCWVGAHPALGEKIAAELLDRGALDEALGATVVKVETQVHNPASSDMRCDFVVTFSDRSRTVLEVWQWRSSGQNACMSKTRSQSSPDFHKGACPRKQDG